MMNPIEAHNLIVNEIQRLEARRREEKAKPAPTRQAYVVSEREYSAPLAYNLSQEWMRLGNEIKRLHRIAGPRRGTSMTTHKTARLRKSMTQRIVEKLLTDIPHVARVKEPRIYSPAVTTAYRRAIGD